MKELETLLNKLIGRWWKPWEIDSDEIYIYSVRENRIIFECPHLIKSYKDLVSLEGGLWQFVCDNKLYNRTYNFRENVRKTWYNIWWFSHNFQYWILESALIPEEELEAFLIDNIKI